MKKILHVTWHMSIGGKERAIYQLIREQRRCGIDAHLLVGSKAGYYGDKTKETNAEVYELGLNSALDFSAYNKIKKNMRNFQIVHIHSNEPQLIKIIANLKHVDIFYTHRSGFRNYNFKKQIRSKVSEHYLKKHFTGLSGNTHHACIAASKLFNIPIEKFSVTYNGLDFDLLKPNRSKNEVLKELDDLTLSASKVIRIGTTGKLIDLKRIHFLLKSIDRLKDQPVHCYIIGDGPAAQKLKQLAIDLQIDNLVTFTGKKEHIGDYLQILDIFAMCSGPEESFGNSAVEAMGIGLPTIIFHDGGGLLEHIENGRTGFIVKDIDELASSIKHLVANPNLRKVIGISAKKAVHEKYSLSKMVESYNNFYQSHYNKT